MTSIRQPAQHFLAGICRPSGNIEQHCGRENRRIQQMQHAVLHGVGEYPDIAVPGRLGSCIGDKIFGFAPELDNLWLFGRINARHVSPPRSHTLPEFVGNVTQTFLHGYRNNFRVCRKTHSENQEALTAEQSLAPVLLSRSEIQSSCGPRRKRGAKTGQSAQRPARDCGLEADGSTVRLRARRWQPHDSFDHASPQTGGRANSTRPGRRLLALGEARSVLAAKHNRHSEQCKAQHCHSRQEVTAGGKSIDCVHVSVPRVGGVPCVQYRRQGPRGPQKSAEAAFGIPKNPSVRSSPTLPSCFTQPPTQRRRSRPSFTVRCVTSSFNYQASRNGPVMRSRCSSLRSCAGIECGISE